MSEAAPKSNNSTVIVVLVIIGSCLFVGCLVIVGLGWIVGGNVAEQIAGANITTTKTQMRSIENYISHYRLENRALPETIADLVGVGAVAGDVPIPTDTWGRQFTYVPAAEGFEYELTSFGADGVPGGTGEDADITRDSLRAR